MLSEQKAENRQMFKIVLTSICYVGRQGLALCGHYKARMNQERELSLIQTEDNPQIFKWMEKSQDKFTSPEIHNEILSIMALHILRSPASYQRIGTLSWLMRPQISLILNGWCCAYNNLEVH